MQHILENIASKIIGVHEFLNFGFLSICIIIGVILLIKAGDSLSDATATLAGLLGVPPILVGLTIVSVATSAPELFTTISAVTSNAKGLILGNIIGSNIANIGLILGISLLIKPIDVTKTVPAFQKITLLLVTFGFSGYLYFTSSHAITWQFGSILLGFLTCYLIFLSYQAVKGKKLIHTPPSVLTDSGSRQNNQWVSLGLIIGASLGLWIGSETLVFGSKSLAMQLGIPEELIGFSIVAVGTSLPELAASIALLKKTQTAMLLGNIIGSNLFNILLVGGIAGLIAPIRSNVTNPWVDHIAMITLTAMLCFGLSGKVKGKAHGLTLLVCYMIASITTWLINA